MEEAGEPAARRPPLRRCYTGFHERAGCRISPSPRSIPGPTRRRSCRRRRGRRRSPRRGLPELDLVEVLLVVGMVDLAVIRRGAIRRRQVLISSHAFWFDGASPNHAATAALASGLMMWSSHMYMQFGFAASELIIQVSDHPVEPSSGQRSISTGRVGLAGSPGTARSFRPRGRRSRTPGSPWRRRSSTRRCCSRCSFSRSIAASNCSSSSSYGSVIPRSGSCSRRYSAASAM